MAWEKIANLSGEGMYAFCIFFLSSGSYSPNDLFGIKEVLDQDRADTSRSAQGKSRTRYVVAAVFQ